jgi:hypothetical protein
MNPSEEATEMAELHLPFNEYCFAYVERRAYYSSKYQKY